MGKGTDGSQTGSHDLLSENRKLKKINQVLITRVERSMDMQGNDFSLFEHAILLESKVRERTEALENVLSDLRKSHQELAGAKAEAERANSSKTRFLAAASHDLLQPLNAARLFVAALSETDQSDPNHKLINNIDTAFASVEDLLNDLLDISKLDAGVQRVALTDLPLGPLLQTLQAEFEPMADEKALAFTAAPSDLVLRSDRHLLGRVLRNLISNALHYTDRGRVQIVSDRSDDLCRISVIDSGPGIPFDQQDIIFDEFKRLNSSEQSGKRGSGLGLAIVRRIARLLEHPLELQSIFGEGSNFSITVPIAERQLTEGSFDTRLDLSLLTRDKTRSVLVIENEAAIRAGMTALLESWGHHVITASSTEDGMQKLEQENITPDLIIADYHLDKDERGPQAIATFRTKITPSVPGLIITADRSPTIQDDIQSQGLPLLTKPVKPAKLRALIQHLLT